MFAALLPEIVGSVIVIFLQAVLAPYMEVGFAIPNLTLAFALAFAVAYNRPYVTCMPFLLGLSFDLLGSGPVGAFALITLLAAYVATRIPLLLQSETFVVPVLSIILVTLAANVLYAGVCVACGWNVSFAEALVLRSLPAWLYDTVIALVLYPVLRFAAIRKEADAQFSSLV